MVFQAFSTLELQKRIERTDFAWYTLSKPHFISPLPHPTILYPPSLILNTLTPPSSRFLFGEKIEGRLKGMEPVFSMSVSPITAPATSQETYGTEKATDSQQGGTSSRSQRSTSDSASTPKGRQASRHRSSPKASPKPHSARKAATTGKTTTVRTTKTRKGARG